MKNRDKVLNALYRGDTTANQVGETTGLSKASVNLELRRIVGEGIAFRENVSKRGGVSWKYTAADKSRLIASGSNYGPLSLPFDKIAEAVTGRAAQCQ